LISFTAISAPRFSCSPNAAYLPVIDPAIAIVIVSSLSPPQPERPSAKPATTAPDRRLFRNCIATPSAPYHKGESRRLSPARPLKNPAPSARAPGEQTRPLIKPGILAHHPGHAGKAERDQAGARDYGEIG